MNWNINEVVSNIELLYSSNDSELINRIQDHLQSIQKSNDGYGLAKLLLDHPSKSCKYFGALTYTVFINTHLIGNDEAEGAELSEGIALELVDRVLTLDIQNDGFIIRKLLSNLSILYISTGKISPLEALLVKFFGTSFRDYGLLNENQLILLLNLNTIIVEDIGKSNRLSNEVYVMIYNEIFPHLSKMLEHLLSVNITFKLHSVVLECVNAWVIYISNTEANSTQRYTEVETENIMKFLLYLFDIKMDMEILNLAFTTLSEVIELNIRMLTPFKTIVSSILFDHDQFGLIFIQQILYTDKYEEYASEVDNFINLIISYLSFNMVHITRNLNSDSIYRIINLALELTNYPATPILEERISEQFLSFWEEFVNVYIDENFTDVTRRDEILNRLSVIYYNKTRFTQNSNEFIHYRQQIAELFIVLHSLLGNPFYSSLCLGIIDNSSKYSQEPSPEIIISLEASLYLLFKITDDLSFYDDDSNQQLIPYVDLVFSHDLIGLAEKLTTSGKVEQIHITLLNFLSCIQFFFKSKSGLVYLTSTFNFLFSVILGKFTNQKNIPIIASKTVLKICQDSKDNLTVFLPNLQLILYELLSNFGIDSLIRERMVNAYVSIANSLKDPVEFGVIVHGLLNKINEVSLVVNPSESELTEEVYISLLTCINETGKASQLPEELEDYFSAMQIEQTNQYWQEDPLQIKQLILTKLSQFSTTLPNSTLVTEQCCNILKHGLNEPVDGPFKFNIDMVVQFIISKVENCNQQSIPYLYKLVESLVVSHGKNLSPFMGPLLGKIFIELQPVLVNEIDLVKSCVDLFTTILQKLPGLLLNLEIFEMNVIKFALDSLRFNETFMIKVIIKFWITFITLKRGSELDQQKMQFYMTTLIIEGRSLCAYLTNNLLLAFLNTARSNLDQFYALFRNLIGKFPMQFKEAMNVLLHDNFIRQAEQSKVNEAQLTQFVLKLMVTRGQRPANDVLRKFWLDYNGLAGFS